MATLKEQVPPHDDLVAGVFGATPLHPIQGATSQLQGARTGALVTVYFSGQQMLAYQPPDEQGPTDAGLSAT